MAYRTSSSYRSLSFFVVLCAFLLGYGSFTCHGLGKFGFDIHHRFSDPVKKLMPMDWIPEKGSVDYYAVMVHRDRMIRERRLASSEDQPPLTFVYGNDTYLITIFGFLHYANVSVGTPSSSYLVALDTGSDLFWLPCDCTSCVTELDFPKGEEIDFNIYSPNISSTSKNIPCSSSLCSNADQCIFPTDACPYRVAYLSDNTSSTGYLVEDVLHLTTDSSDNTQLKTVDANITLGCGKVQTGSFLDTAAPNGLFGLGMENVSVPSILANEGISSNSFSLCFGPDGIGRIEFGDSGSSDQSETPFNLGQKHPTYNISITQITVRGNASDLDFTAIFDSGTSFTYLNDPAYSLITQKFDSLISEKPHSGNTSLPFDYCYDFNTTSKTFIYPKVNFTMKGGDELFITAPLVAVSIKGGYIYCLGVVKSDSVNIIGQNFMTGYRIVFDRTRNVLGWKASNCYDEVSTNSLPVTPAHSPAVSPATAVNPQATSSDRPTSGTPPPLGSHATRSSSILTGAIVMALLPFLAIV